MSKSNRHLNDKLKKQGKNKRHRDFKDGYEVTKRQAKAYDFFGVHN